MPGQQFSPDLTQFSDQELAAAAASDDLPVAAQPTPDTPATVQAPSGPQRTAGEQVGRAGGLTVRSAIDAAAGLPLMAMDAGVAARNLGGDLLSRVSIGGHPVQEPTPDYGLPSTMYNQGLNDAGLPQPEGLGERIPTALISAVIGAKMPGGGSPESPTPANFEDPQVTAAKLRAPVLTDAQALGAQVPPSTTNPTWFNRTLETVAGKDATAAHTLQNNEQVRAQAANLTLGNHPNTPLTIDSMEAIMAESGKAYDAAKNVPLFKTSQQYLDRLTQIAHENQGANESFPGASSPDVDKVIDTYLQPTMTGSAATSAIKLLRGKAADAYASGNSELGRVYRQISGAVEDELASGADRAGMYATVSKLKQARMDYAKAATIRDSMLPDGTIDGPKLAAAWQQDVPLSGPLDTMAQFAKQFPKANATSSVKGSPVHHLQSLESIGPALYELQHGLEDPNSPLLHTLGRAAAAGAVIPGARYAARRYLLSPSGQRGAIPAAARGGAGQPPLQVTPGMYAAGLQALGGSGSTPP